MPSKFQLYQQLSNQTAREITEKRGNWTNFFDTAAKLYKYPFPDQLLIHAQRPDAVACAPIETWNDNFNRWVRRGSKGIALIDDTGNYPRLKYVFDITDTEPSLYNSRPVYLWEMRQEHREIVLDALDKVYDDVGDTLSELFRSIAKQLAREYYEDNAREIGFRAEDSHFTNFDATRFTAAFEDALANSIAYTLMARCGFDTDDYFDDADFQFITNFNTPDMVYALGTASNELSAQVLKDIELTVKKYERMKVNEKDEQTIERGASNERDNVHAGRGLPDTGHQVERTAEGVDRTVGTVREDAEIVSERTQDDNVQHDAVERDVVSASTGYRGSGERTDDAGDGDVDGTEQSTRQIHRPDELDGGDERIAGAGGGDGVERVDLQRLNLTQHSMQIEPPSVILSQLGTSSLSAILSTSAVSLAEVDAILRDGGNYYNHKLHITPYEFRSSLRIAAFFAKDLGAEENTRFLKSEFLSGRYGNDYSESGKGVDFGDRRVSVWYDVEGITLAVGETAKYGTDKITIPWEYAAVRVDELLRDGQYITRHSFVNALDNDLYELADRIWFFYRDDFGGIPDDFRGENGGHPGDVAVIRSLLENPDKRQMIRDRLEADINEWSYNTEKRHSWNNPFALLDIMNYAMYPPVILPNDNFTPDNIKYFITKDEIDALIARGGAYNDSKFNLSSFFLGDHDDKEKLAFIKKNYGHGGGTYCATNGHYNAEPGNGLTLERGWIGNPDASVNLNWPAVIKRTEYLINEGLYMTRAELDRLPNYERLMLVRDINRFFYDLPDEYERPYNVRTWQNYTNTDRVEMDKLLDFNYPREAEWQAIRDFLDDSERADTVLEQMRYIFENTSTDDKHYKNRKAGYENLLAYRYGTYTLFPGLDELPDPETAAAKFSVHRVDGLSTSQQMTLFDLTDTPVFPSVDEQRTRIDRTSQQNDDIDALLLEISDADKMLITEQFSDNPRSRETVNLIRDIYGDGLGIPLPQAVKRIEELVNDGAFNVLNDIYSLFDMVRDELSERGFTVSGELVENGIGEYNSRGGKGNAQDIADFIEDEYLSDNPKSEITNDHPIDETAEFTPNEVFVVFTSANDDGDFFPIGEILTYNEADDLLREAEDVWQNSDVYDEQWVSYLSLNYRDDDGNIHKVPFRYEIGVDGEHGGLCNAFKQYWNEEIDKSNTDRSYDWHTPNEIAVATQIIAILESEMTLGLEVDVVEPYVEATVLDFNSVAQSVLQRLLSDEAFVSALNGAQGRGSIRNPLNTALESVINEYR
jgi:hypothetical protein